MLDNFWIFYYIGLMLNSDKKILNPYLLFLLKSIIRRELKGDHLQNLSVLERQNLGGKLGIGKEYNVKIFAIGQKTPFSLDLNTLDLLVSEISHLEYKDWNDFVKKELDDEARLFPEIPFQNLDNKEQLKIRNKTKLRIEKIFDHIPHEEENIEKQEIKIEDIPISTKTTSKRKYWGIAGICSVILIVIFIISKTNSRNDYNQIQAHNYLNLIEYGSISAPQTVYFKYNVRGLPKPVVIKYYGLEEKTTIDTIINDVGTIGEYYERPGTYKVLLYSKNNLIFEKSFTVKTDGWYSLAAPINKDRLEKLYELEKPCDFIENGVMVFPKENFRDIIYCHFTKVGDIDIDGNNFEFSIKMKNNSLKEYDSRIWLWGEKGTKLVACFVGEGAEKYSYLYLGDDYKISGKENPFLKNFSFDLSKWRTITVKMKENKASIYLDGMLISGPHQMKENLKTIKGIRITFKGYGMIDSLFLQDAKKRYVEDFDRCDEIN